MGSGMQSLAYVVLSLVLGGLAVWASENLFWLVPPPGITVPNFLLTVVAYSIAAAVALSAVIWSGVQGLRAAFLGGAVLGYMSEGVIVGTIYQMEPPLFYLVWTPLAWHALLTGGVILGLGRLRISPMRRLVLWGGLGLCGAFWAQYWPSERPDLPDRAALAVYLIGAGLMVPLAHVVMDRLGQVPRPRTWVLCVAPVIAALVWGLQGAYDLNPFRLVLIAVLAALLWVMRRLGGQGPVLLGGPVPVWHHLLFLVAPLTVVVLAPMGWAQGWGTLEANWVVAGLTCVLSVAVLGRLIWSAAQRA